MLHCCEADVFSKELGQVTLGLWIWMSAQQFSHETGLGVARQCPSFDLILSECIMEEESCKEILRLSKTLSSLCWRARICELGTQYCPLHCYPSLCESSHFSWISNISNEVSALAFDISTQANSHECLVLESYSEILAGSELMRVRYGKSHSNHCTNMYHMYQHGYLLVIWTLGKMGPPFKEFIEPVRNKRHMSLIFLFRFICFIC